MVLQNYLNLGWEELGWERLGWEELGDFNTLESTSIILAIVREHHWRQKELQRPHQQQSVWQYISGKITYLLKLCD